MKKIMIIGLIILSVFLIYLCNLDNKVYYLSLNDDDNNFNYATYIKNYLKEKDVLEVYIPEFSKNSLRTIDVINNIENNEIIKKNNKEITFKNALIKADLVTLSFYPKDIIRRIDSNNIYDYIDDLNNDLNKLLKLMREYCKEDIILVGYYNPYPDNVESTKIFKYLNKKYAETALKYKVTYINLEKVFEGHPDFLNENKLPNQAGENMIASQIINEIDKKMLKS